MRTSEMSRLVVTCFVFLMVWKETLQMSPENHKDTRSKRYHESDEKIYAAEIKKNKNIKSNVPTVPINQGSQIRPLNLGMPKKTPTFIPQSKIIRVRPMNIKNKNNLANHKPYVFYVNNNELPKRHIQSKNTSADIENSNERAVQEIELDVEKTVDTVEVDKAIHTNESYNNFNLVETKFAKVDDKNVEELDKVTEGNIEIFENCTNDNSITIPQTPMKNPRKSKDQYESESVAVSENPLKKNKKSRKLKTEAPNASVSLEDKQAVTVGIENKENEKNTEETTTKQEDLESIDLINTQTTEKHATKELQRKHPFLDTIQNEKYLTCSPFDKPNDFINEFQKNKTDNNTAPDIETETKISDVGTEVMMAGDDEIDENEGVLVRQSKYDEVQEITYSKALKNLQIDNVQDKINVSPYNSYQGQYNNYQEVSRPTYANYELNNQYNYAPDEQKIEQVDGATVVSYKNYYKTLKPYWNNNRNYCYPSYYNYNGNYGNNNQRLLNNNYGVYQPTPPAAGDARARIWKSWKNTDYFIKSRNALQQIRSGNILNNSLINPSHPRNMNLFQRHNVVPVGF